jgi:hypothetical protein
MTRMLIEKTENHTRPRPRYDVLTFVGYVAGTSLICVPGCERVPVELDGRPLSTSPTAPDPGRPTMLNPRPGLAWASFLLRSPRAALILLPLFLLFLFLHLLLLAYFLVFLATFVSHACSFFAIMTRDGE